MRAGGRGVLGVYYLLENIIHYYYCQSEWGEDSSQRGEDSPPLENTLGGVIIIETSDSLTHSVYGVLCIVVGSTLYATKRNL